MGYILNSTINLSNPILAESLSTPKSLIHSFNFSAYGCVGCPRKYLHIMYKQKKVLSFGHSGYGYTGAAGCSNNAMLQTLNPIKCCSSAAQ